MYIINAKINTVTNGVIERGFLQIEDGKIAKVGPMEELDAQGDALDMHEMCIRDSFYMMQSVGGQLRFFIVL